MELQGAEGGVADALPGEHELLLRALAVGDGALDEPLRLGPGAAASLQRRVTRCRGAPPRRECRRRRRPRGCGCRRRRRTPLDHAGEGLALADAGRVLLLVHQLLLLNAAPQGGRRRRRPPAAAAAVAVPDLAKRRRLDGPGRSASRGGRPAAPGGGPDADAVALLVGARGPGEQGPEEGTRRLQLRVHGPGGALLAPAGGAAVRLSLHPGRGLRIADPRNSSSSMPRRDRRGAPPAAATSTSTSAAAARVSFLLMLGLVQPAAPEEHLIPAGRWRRRAPAHPELEPPARTEIQVDVLLLSKALSRSSRHGCSGAHGVEAAAACSLLGPIVRAKMAKWGKEERSYGGAEAVAGRSV